jgi:hypothetical protein
VSVPERGSLTKEERDLVARLLSDPMAFPPKFKAWLGKATEPDDSFPWEDEVKAGRTRKLVFGDGLSTEEVDVGVLRIDAAGGGDAFPVYGVHATEYDPVEVAWDEVQWGSMMNIDRPWSPWDAFEPFMEPDLRVPFVPGDVFVAAATNLHSETEEHTDEGGRIYYGAHRARIHNNTAVKLPGYKISQIDGSSSLGGNVKSEGAIDVGKNGFIELDDYDYRVFGPGHITLEAIVASLTSDNGAGMRYIDVKDNYYTVDAVGANGYITAEEQFRVNGPGYIYGAQRQMVVNGAGYLYVDQLYANVVSSGGYLFGRHWEMRTPPSGAAFGDQIEIQHRGGKHATHKLDYDFVLGHTRDVSAVGHKITVTEYAGVALTGAVVGLHVDLDGDSDHRFGVSMNAPLHFYRPKTAEPVNPLTSEALLYLWNDSGTYKLVANVNGTKTVLATG